MRCGQCNKEIERGKYCGPACKQRAYRNRTVTDKPVGVTVTPGNVVTVTQHQRCTDPDTLEIWARHKAQRRPTTYPHASRAANLAVPGDPDYDGVCIKDDKGVWRACG